MNDNFILRSGKYQGKTIAWVKKTDNNYLVWVKENRPEMLKELVPKEPTIRKMIPDDVKISAMQPNLNFWNEGPDEKSLIYLKKQKDNDN
jgi:hypothetical protein